MKKKLILDKELVTAGLDTITLDGGSYLCTYATIGISCEPNTCPSATCVACPDPTE